MFMLFIFCLPVKRFKETLSKHTSVEVCVVLPKFKLSLIQIKPLPVAQHGRGPDQTVAQTADCADLCDAAAVEKDSRHKDLAYVLHTSGTTGLPKNVRVPHKCILPNILHMRSVFICLLALLLSLEHCFDILYCIFKRKP